ncbi:MAG: ABC transporter ATP-binding protein, partial [Nakamurella sp.]
STLMSAAAGLLALTEGRIEVEGTPVSTTPAHPGLGYLAQDKPLYRRYRVRDMLDIGRHLNTGWDDARARRLVDEAGVPLDQRVGKLSGGQRTRLALALVLARRPSVLLLDEPLADLDPLARLEVQQTLMTEVLDTGMTVLLSSHILGEIQDACEDLLLLQGGGIVLDGALESLLSRHRVLVGPGTDPAGNDLAWLPANGRIEVRRAARQTTVLVDHQVSNLPAGWTAADPTLDELVVAYLRAGRAAQPPGPGSDQGGPR